jgi:hypothetical protein
LFAAIRREIEMVRAKEMQKDGERKEMEKVMYRRMKDIIFVCKYVLHP